MRTRFFALKDKLNTTQFRKIFEDNFENEEEIMAAMPDYKKYLKKKIEGSSPVYAEPLLSREQEWHLFRQYNFLKYKFKEIVSKDIFNTEIVENLESLVKKFNDIRKRLIYTNTRLILHIFKKYSNVDTDSFVSDGYYAMLLAVDAFDYRRGIKFCTYVYWVIVDVVRKSKYQNDGSPITGMEEILNEKLCKINMEEEIHRNEKNNFVHEILEKVHPREKEIIMDLYGLKGHKLTLEQIGKKLNLSKERVRQINKNAIIGIKRRLNEKSYS